MKIDLIFLLKAIIDGEEISIFHKQKNDTPHYFSRFYKVLSKEESIIIDLPYADNYTQKRLVKNDIISVYFLLAGFRFHFNSKVKETTYFSLEDGTKIPALKITWPKEILDGNRRSLFRITVYLAKTIVVRYIILGNIKDNKSFAGAEGVEYDGIEAIMIDISENGIALEIKRKINIGIGDRLKLRFQMEEEDKEEIEIEGIVRNIREFPGSVVHICGIEFASKKTTQYKRFLRKIVFYIISKNRENVSFFTLNQTVLKNPFVQKILDNEVTEGFLHMLLLKKLPLSDEEYLESFVFILKIGKFKDNASKMLSLLPYSIKEKYIQRIDANHMVANFLLEEAISRRNLTIIAGAVNNQYLPEEFLLKIAEKGTASMLRVLLANKIKMIAYPEILDLIENNPNTTSSINEKIKDLRESYLHKQESELIPEAAVINGVSDLITAQEKESTEKAESLKTGVIKKKALAILQRINEMSLQQRIKLAFTGDKSERIILSKDSNEFVVQAVLESPKISEDEVLILAQNKSIPKKIVNRICENKIWFRNYPIMLALLKNPNMPAKKAAGHVKKLHPRDLHQLAMDKNINPIVRKLARYLYTKRK